MQSPHLHIFYQLSRGILDLRLERQGARHRHRQLHVQQRAQFRMQERSRGAEEEDGGRESVV